MPSTLAEHVMDVAAHRRRHPYAIVGIERSMPAIARGFALLQNALAGTGLEPPAIDFEAENVHLPSTSGVAYPAATALSSHMGVDFCRPLSGRWGVLQLAGQSYFDAKAVIRGLLADGEALSGTAAELEVIEVDWDGSSPSAAVARSLDDQANVEKLLRALRGKTDGLVGIIAPPVLGISRHATVHAKLSESMGMPVVEALGRMPSVPGMRLQLALEAALEAAGVESVGEVVEAKTRGNALQSLLTRDSLEISASSFVLASGRFISGGVRWQERCEESLLGLPIVTEDGLLEDDSPSPLIRDTPMESHPLMTAGIQVDGELRPMREGQVPFENLYAAGMVIGGFASRYVLCADGVALATGWLAGRAAAKRGSDS